MRGRFGRRRRVCCLGLPLVLTLLFLFAESLPARGDELGKLLRRPLSPGSVVLLAKYPAEPRVAERLDLALRSQDAATRGVAARVVSLAGRTALLPAVGAALSAESDEDAAKEEVRTLVSFGGSRFDETVLMAAQRLAPKLDRELVRMVARVRGPQALSLYFSTLRDLALSPSDREAFFRLATRGQADYLVAASALAFGRKDFEAWQAILNVAGDLGHKLDQPVIIEALRSKEVVFRGEAAWYLARAHCDSPPRNAEEILAAISEPQAGAQPQDPELRFGAEMLRRVLGRPPVEDDGWIACLESNPDCHLDSDFEQSPLISFLTPREREAIIRRNEANLPPEAKPGGMSPPGPPKESTLRLVAGLPKGVVQDLFEIEGCRSTARSRLFSVAVMDFRADGLPRKISVQAVPHWASCRRAAESLFLMALAPADEHLPPDRQIAYVVPLDPDGMLCNEGSSAATLRGAEAAPDIVRVRAKVVPPKLLKKVEPFYPEAARRNGEQGISIYEAIITSTGCIRDLKLLRSSTPMLDVSGILAVAKWLYQPATLDNRPLSVYLTVTVTYQLH